MEYGIWNMEYGWQIVIAEVGRGERKNSSVSVQMKRVKLWGIGPGE